MQRESHQLVLWSLSSPPQSSSSGVVSDRCELTWRNKLQAQTDMLQPLLDQFPSLALLDALFRSSRQAKDTRIAVSAAHNHLLLSILTLETYCATLTGPPCDVMYDRAHFLEQAEWMRFRPRFLQKLLEQKILVNST